MSWLISLVIAGSLFTSGNSISDYQFEQASRNSSGANRPVLLDETQRFEKSYPFSSNGKIEVSNVSGTIDIKAWNRNEIKLVYIKKADTKEHLNDVKVEIDAQNDSFKIEVKYPHSRYSSRHKNNSKRKSRYKNKRKWRKGTSASVNFELMVPKNARLDSIGNISGSVTLTNMAGYSKVSVVSGSVRATNLRGTARLNTVSGTVSAAFRDLNKGSDIKLGTISGSVKLIIPSNSNATVTANTLSGSIKNDFGLLVRKGRYVGRDLHGKIGSGNVPIRLNSISGSLSLQRQNDGKTLSPSTNLLKKADDDDDEDVIDVNIEVPQSPDIPQPPEIASRNRETRKMRKARERTRFEGVVVPKIDLDKLAVKATVEAMRSFELSEEERVLINEKLREKLTSKELSKELRKINEKFFLMSQKELKKKFKEFQKNRFPMFAPIIERENFGSSAFIQEVKDTIPVKGVPAVDIHANNCDVIVHGWKKSKVKYSLSQINRSRSTKPIELRAADEKNISIKVRARAFGQSGMRLEVFVPKKSQLEIHSGREIRLDGVSGDLKLVGGRNSVNVRDSSGNLNVITYSGMIRVLGFDGEVKSKTMSGPVMLEGDFEKIFASTGGSNVTVTVPENLDAKIITSGRIDFGNFPNIERDEESGFWRIGDGEAQFRFDIASGLVHIRTKSSFSSE